MSSRIKFIDSAKTIGIIFIVLGHLNFSGYYFIYLFHVPLFFIISGYLQSLKHSILFDIKRLLYPYLFYNVILCLYSDCSFDILKNIFLGNQSLLPVVFKPLWFLVSLCWMKILYHLICSNFGAMIVSFLSILLYIFLSNMCFTKHLYFQIAPTLLSIPFYYIGVLLKHISLVRFKGKILELRIQFLRVFSKRKPLKVFFLFSVIIFITFCFITLIFLILNFGPVNIVRCQTGQSILVFYILATLICVIYLFICYRFLNFENKFFRTISSGTLFILCTHSLQADIIERLFFAPINDFTSILTTGIIICISYPIIFLVKKNQKFRYLI